MLLGLGTAWIGTNAFIGSLASTVIVFGLSRTHGAWTQSRLLLTGVVVAAGWGAAISFLLAISPGSNVQGMLFWLIGDMSYATHPAWAYATLVAGLLLSLPLARSLNLYARGELVAAALGANARLCAHLQQRRRPRRRLQGLREPVRLDLRHGQLVQRDLIAKTIDRRGLHVLWGCHDSPQPFV